MGVPASRRNNNLIQGEIQIFELFQNLLRGNYIAKRSERLVTGRQRDDVGTAAPAPQLARYFIQAPVSALFVLTFRVGVNGRAEDAIQKNVSGGAINSICLRYSLLKLDMTIHSKLASRGRRQTDKIRLHRAGDQYRVCSNGARLA